MTARKPLLREPFFVVGSPRSGTTLLRLMLTCHPSLVVPPECGFVIWLHPSFGEWRLREFADPAHRSRFATEVSQSRKFRTWSLSSTDVAEAVRDGMPLTYGDACAAIYKRYCARLGKEGAIWGDKNNYYLNHIASLSSIFPGARFIHLVRDGRDVACSYREVMSIESDSPYRPSLPLEIDKIAIHWANDVRTIRRQFEGLGADRTFTLRYENLVAQPAAELALVCNWLGLPFSSEMLEFHVANRLHHLEPRETMDWKARTLRPVTADTVGRHGSILTPEENREFERVAGAELRNHAYVA